MQPMNRVQPNLPASAYKTFQIASPVSTHWRKATCVEAECGNFLHGWKSLIDESTELGQRQAYYIRAQSGRKFAEDTDSQPGLTVFVFEAGQECFGADQHKVPLDRPEHYLVKGGDWRGNPLRTPARKHTRPEFWIEEFQENQDRLIRHQERG